MPPVPFGQQPPEVRYGTYIGHLDDPREAAKVEEEIAKLVTEQGLEKLEAAWKTLQFLTADDDEALKFYNEGMMPVPEGMEQMGKTPAMWSEQRNDWPEDYEIEAKQAVRLGAMVPRFVRQDVLRDFVGVRPTDANLARGSFAEMLQRMAPQIAPGAEGIA